MLKRIAVSDLRLGMHVAEVCGSWIQHPFWKSSFTLRDDAALIALRTSAVKECWIDTAKGIGLDEPATPLLGAAPVPAAASLSPAHSTQKRTAKKCSLESEMKRAKLICNQAREGITRMFAEARLGQAVDARGCEPLVDEIAESVSRNAAAFVGLVRLRDHDDYTFMHSVAVCVLMVALARQLQMEEPLVRQAGVAGMLHDLGKAVIPLEVLNKPGSLTDSEFKLMKTHSARGHGILLNNGIALDVALDVCLHHHEKVDGSGYPKGIKGNEISIFAKMGAVCDVYDAVTSHRPYRAAWEPAMAIRKMASWSGTHFDTAVFQAFVKTVGLYPTGTLVRLNSGKLAVVMESGHAVLTAPRVKAFYSTKSQMAIPPILIDLSVRDCTETIESWESNDKWQFAYLNDLWVGGARPAGLRTVG